MKVHRQRETESESERETRDRYHENEKSEMRKAFRIIWCWCIPVFVFGAAVVVLAEGGTASENGTDETGPAAPPAPHTNVAVVTLLHTAAYVPGAEVLVQSLNQAGAMGDRILLYVGPETDPRSDLTPEHLEDLRLAGWNRTIGLTKDSDNYPYTECKIYDEAVAQIESGTPWSNVRRFWGCCSKFAIWTLTEYDAVVYMDADSFVLHNFDEIYENILGDDDDATGHGDSNSNRTLFALATPPCWEDPPDCKDFYTAFLLIKPQPEVHDALQQLTSKIMEPWADSAAINERFVSQWGRLPRYTMVAQSETARPTVVSEDDTSTEHGKVDWSVVKVYDFAGPPAGKPWVTHQFQKATQNPYVHGFALKGVEPDSIFAQRYLHPQWLWNGHYEAVLKAKHEAKETKKTTATAKGNGMSGEL